MNTRNDWADDWPMLAVIAALILVLFPPVGTIISVVLGAVVVFYMLLTELIEMVGEWRRNRRE